MRLRLLAALLLLLGSGAPASAAVPATPELRFLRDGAAPKVLTLQDLSAACTVETIHIDDPYYGARKSYLACPLGQVLRQGFGALIERFPGQTVIFRARD